MVRLKRSGQWALAGHRAVELTKDQKVDFGPRENAALVEAGWAEHIDAKAEGKADGGDKSVDKNRSQGRQQGQRNGSADAQ